MDYTPQIIQAVHAIDSELIVTSTIRPPGEGLHSLACAVDFGHKDPSRLFKVFEALQDQDWKGGIGIGIPPAMIHLHVDGRNWLGAYPAAVWIETNLWGPNYTQSIKGFSTDWNDTLNKARKIYGAE